MDSTENKTNGANKMNAVTAKSELKDITKAIRKEARAFAKTFGCTVSVTRKNYSTIRVTVVSSERNHICPEFRAWAVANPDGSAVSYQMENGMNRTVAQFTDWANELLTGLEAIASQYNWDKSDIMTDYFNCNFYQFIRFDPFLTEDAKAERDAEREIEETVEAPAPVENVVAVNFGGAVVAAESDVEAELAAQLAQLEERREALELAVERAQRIKKLEDAIAQEVRAIEMLSAELSAL